MFDIVTSTEVSFSDCGHCYCWNCSFSFVLGYGLRWVTVSAMMWDPAAPSAIVVQTYK